MVKCKNCDELAGGTGDHPEWFCTMIGMNTEPFVSMPMYAHLKGKKIDVPSEIEDIDEERECEFFREIKPREKWSREKWLSYMLGYMASKGWRFTEESLADFKEAFPEMEGDADSGFYDVMMEKKKE